MIRRSAAAVAALALVLAALLTPAAPAAAVPSCLSNTLCLYPDGGFGQPSNEWDSADFPIGTCKTYLSPTTSYIDNNMGRRFYVYQTSTCRSDAYSGVIYPRSEGPMSGVWNNSIRAIFASSLTY